MQMSRIKEKDREYYSLSLRVEKGTPLAEWLKAQDSKSASIKALINVAIDKYGTDQDIIRTSMCNSMVGRTLAGQSLTED